MPRSQDELTSLCRDARRKIVRMLAAAGSGHPGGSLSCVEILTSIFYHRLGRTAANARDPDRHRLVLSKGHGVPALYALLAQVGIIPERELATLRRLDGRLQGHPDVTRLAEVECSTGSLGQGLSIAQGMALAARLDGSARRVWCVLGDGECQEGQVWEAGMSAAHYRLDGLTAVIDANRGQIDGHVPDVMGLEPLPAKFAAFGWHALEVADGHDLAALAAAFDEAEAVKGRPTVIVARTVKGKGVSFMENQIAWHGVAPDAVQARRALAELGEGEGDS